MTGYMRWSGLLALLVCFGAGAAERQSFVWRVSDADNSVYLAGSVHLLPPDAYPLPAGFQNAYEAAEIVVFETEMGQLQSESAQMLLVQAGRYADGSSLESHLDPAFYTRLKQVLAEVDLPLTAVRSFRPWLVAGMIELRAFMGAGYRQDLGVDAHFYEQAREDDKAVLPLETLPDHLAVLTEMPLPMARAYLQATVDNVDALEAAPSAVYDLWRAGDAAGLADYVQAQVEAAPALYDRLLFARNRAWLMQIKDLLAGDADAMVVVGALHLIGEQGLVQQLQGGEYQVERY